MKAPTNEKQAGENKKEEEEKQEWNRELRERGWGRKRVEKEDRQGGQGGGVEEENAASGKRRSSVP